MTYQDFRNKRDELVTELDNTDLRVRDIITPIDYDCLFYFIEEYEELTRQMLQYIKTPKRGKE